MEDIKLKHQLDENTVVKTLFDVHRLRRLSQDQLSDILSVQPNHLPPVVERTNEFLEKMAHLVTMYKLQDKCEDEKYTNAHPEEAKVVDEYFAKDDPLNDKAGDEIVAL